MEVRKGGKGWWYRTVVWNGGEGWWFDMVVGMLVWKVGIEDGM